MPSRWAGYRKKDTSPMNTPTIPFISSMVPWGVITARRGETMNSAPDENSPQPVKKTMTSVDIMAWLGENQGILKTSRINNVYRAQSLQNIYIFKLHTRNGTKHLVIEPATRIHFTEYKIPTPNTPDGLTMAIRRHVRGAIIKDVEQIGFDRIVSISLSNRKKILVELLPRGVISVVDENNKILVASEYREMRDRVIRPGSEYQLPPHFAEKPTKEKCIHTLLTGSRRNLVKQLGIPTDVVKEALWRSESEEPSAICENMVEIIEESLKGYGFLASEHKSGVPVYFSSFEPKHMSSQTMFRVEKTSSFNDAVDRFFSHGLVKRMAEESLKEEATASVKLQRLLEKEYKLIEDYEKGSKELYEKATLIMTFRHLVEEALQCVNEVKNKIGWNEVVNKCQQVERVDPRNGRVLIRVHDGKVVEVAVNVPVKEQIEELFENAKKLKKKATAAKKHLALLEERLKKDRERAEKTRVMIIKSVRRREWYENFWWTITRNGYLVIAGKDASQNEVLVRKYLEEHDIFLHADIHGAPATILKNKHSDIPPEDDIVDASILAASYSRAWKEGILAVDVFWVRSDQVSKSPPPGQYLSKGSFMIYGKKNYVRNVKLELAVGVQELDEGARYIVGSLEALKVRATPLAIISPGGEARERVARRIVERAWSRNVKTPPPAELSSLIPGNSRLVKLLI